MGKDNRELAIDRMDRFGSINYIIERPFIAADLIRSLCGDIIGVGAYRIVYEYGGMTAGAETQYVMKFSPDERANQLEFNTWEYVHGTEMEKWFAPCLWISPCGHFMVQKRVRPVKEGDKLPSMLPAFFSDVKKSNFGWLKGKLVCHDYQFIGKAVKLSFKAKKQKAIWV